MLGPIVAAQFDLENTLDELARNAAGAASGPIRDQLQALGNLQRQIAGADPAALAAMRAEIAAAMTASQAVAQQARGAIADTATADALGLTGAGNASRAQVTALMQDMHRFPVRFSSPEDEATYREREAERRAFIEAEQAKHTPQGDLDTSAGAIGQMADIKAHGGGDSPEFQQRWNALVATTERLREAVRASGGSTAEFDDRLRADLRRILKAKGLTDAQIDAQFAAHPDPLEAAKTFVNDKDVRQVEARENVRADSVLSVVAVQSAPQPPAGIASGGLADAVSNLQGLGIVATDHDAATNPSHGVTANAAPAAGRNQGIS